MPLVRSGWSAGLLDGRIALPEVVVGVEVGLAADAEDQPVARLAMRRALESHDIQWRLELRGFDRDPLLAVLVTTDVLVGFVEDRAVTDRLIQATVGPCPVGDLPIPRFPGVGAVGRERVCDLARRV